MRRFERGSIVLASALASLTWVGCGESEPERDSGVPSKEEALASQDQKQDIASRRSALCSIYGASASCDPCGSIGGGKPSWYGDGICDTENGSWGPLGLCAEFDELDCDPSHRDGFGGVVDPFDACHDYVDADGQPSSSQPEGAPELYRIAREGSVFPGLVPVDALPPGAEDSLFELIIEDVRFTTYKCWSSPQNGSAITGFDAQLITELLAETDYDYVRFIGVPWTTTVAPLSAEIGAACGALVGTSKSEIEADSARSEAYEKCAADGEVEFQLSLFTELNRGRGDAASGGASITRERLEWGQMIGPIYKADKFFVARRENDRLDPSAPDHSIEDLCARYEPMRGLTVIESASNIRGEFLSELASRCSSLVEIAAIGVSELEGTEGLEGDALEQAKANNRERIAQRYAEIIAGRDTDRLTFVDVVDYGMIEDFVNGGMSPEASAIFGDEVDLVMVDSGSANALKESGVLGGALERASRSLSKDADLGTLFGIGDGIMVRFGDDDTARLLTERLKVLVADGTIARLVERWFDDENAADPACVGAPASCL